MYFLSLKFNVRKHLFISGILYPLAIRCDLNSVSFFSNSDMLFVLRKYLCTSPIINARNTDGG